MIFEILVTKVLPTHESGCYTALGMNSAIVYVAKAQGQELEELRKRDDVKWTFINPAGDFQADGERTGKYILAGEELTLNSKGESIISYADYAIVMVDEIEKGNNIKKRISVVRE